MMHQTYVKLRKSQKTHLAMVFKSNISGILLQVYLYSNFGSLKKLFAQKNTFRLGFNFEYLEWKYMQNYVFLNFKVKSFSNII